MAALLALSAAAARASETVVTDPASPWSVPAGVTGATVAVWGGGGGGGGQDSANDGASGGGGGAYSQKFLSVTPGNSYTVSRGDGGLRGTAGCGAGGADSWFDTVGTVFAKGGAGGCNSTGTPPAGGLGGDKALGVGDLKNSGGRGGKGFDGSDGRGGPGGSSAGTAVGADGTPGPDPWSTVTAAAAPAGGGKGGDGGISGAPGVPGELPGGGGGGSGDTTSNMGGSGRPGRVTITYTDPPTVTNVAPNTGSTVGGTAITITGTLFVSGATVMIGGVAATGVIFDGPTQLRATTPAGTAGAKNVVVTNPNTHFGTLVNGFTYYEPTVTAINPSSGPTTGGTFVTITGTYFSAGATVKIGNDFATGVTVVSDTSITATTIGSTTGDGAKNVVVTNTDTKYGTLVNGFTHYDAPTVTAVEPSSGPLTAISITITGTNFIAGATVKIGGTAATGVTVVSDTSITATTPALSAGARNVEVTTAGGVGTKTGGFTYVNAPTVTTVDPSSGPVGGGTGITITGTDFTNVSAVTIGGVSATGITVLSATSITATTPAGTLGARDVVVTTPYGVGTMTGGFTYVNVPTITTVYPSSGPVAGGTAVTLTGTAFTVASAVTIGGVPAGFSVTDATHISIPSTPAGARGKRDVVVTTPGGVATKIEGFIYLGPEPTVTGIAPDSGSTAGGTAVIITGTDFDPGSGVTVKIGAYYASGVSVTDATHVSAATPSAGAAGPGARDVVVTNIIDTQFDTLTNGFTYVTPPPQVTIEGDIALEGLTVE